MGAPQRPRRHLGDGTRASVLGKAVEILAAFQPGQLEMTIPELAAALGEARSTVYRYVRVLLQKDLLARGHQEHTYRPAMHWLQITRTLRRTSPLVAAAQPVMGDLAVQTGESVFLTVLYEHQAMCLERVESRRGLRTTMDPGDTIPLHASSLGKVILAWAPPAVIAAVVAAGLETLTPHTVTDPVRLQAQLAQIRRDGYAMSSGERRPGVSGVSVPVFWPDGALAAGLSVTTPAERFTPARARQLLPPLRKAARQIGARLGRRGEA